MSGGSRGARLSFVFAGYFPKRIALATEAMGLPGVSEIWSASHCISEGPDGWIQRWKHNRLGLFDTRALAEAVLPADSLQAFRILGFRIASSCFGEHGEEPLDLSDLAALAPSAQEHVIAGYDAVSSSGGSGFECSPLSCNGAAKELVANEKCLLSSAEAAIAAARRFAEGDWEPGPYLVVEVLELL